MLCNDLTPLNEIGDSQQLGTWDAEQLPHRLPWGWGGAGGRGRCERSELLLLTGERTGEGAGLRVWNPKHRWQFWLSSGARLRVRAPITLCLPGLSFAVPPQLDPKVPQDRPCVVHPCVPSEAWHTAGSHGGCVLCVCVTGAKVNVSPSHQETGGAKRGQNLQMQEPLSSRPFICKDTRARKVGFGKGIWGRM